MALIKSISAGKLDIRVYDNREDAGRAAAKDGADVLRKLLSVPGREMVNVIFAAAPSQNDTLSALKNESGIDWTRVRAFHMDEYVGFGKDRKESFGSYLYEHVFGNNFFSQRDVMICLVNKALRHVDTGETVMIEVSNEDYDMLIGMKASLFDKVMIKNEPEIVRRDDFKKGQAKIETPYGIIDCSIDTELTELTRHLKMLSYEGRKGQ